MAAEHSPGRVVFDADWHELKLAENGYVVATLPRPHPTCRGKERAEELATIRANGERLAALWNAALGVDADAAMQADAVDTLNEEGWTWDGDQWQRPALGVKTGGEDQQCR